VDQPGGDLEGAWGWHEGDYSSDSELQVSYPEFTQPIEYQVVIILSDTFHLENSPTTSEKRSWRLR